MFLNDRNAEKICETEIYPDGANHPTLRTEYKCACGKGKIIFEQVPGFGDFYAYFECPKCEEKYDFRYSCGCIWELKEK